MKRLLPALAAAAIAASLISPAANAMPDDEFDQGIRNVKNSSCTEMKNSFSQNGEEYLKIVNIKTRNDFYDFMLNLLNSGEMGGPALSNEQVRKMAAVSADKAAECKLVTFPITERVTTFFGSKGENSSTSSVAGFSS